MLYNKRLNVHKIRACNIHVNIYFPTSRITELLLFLKHLGTTPTHERTGQIFHLTSQIPVKFLVGLFISPAIYIFFLGTKIRFECVHEFQFVWALLH